MLLNHIHSGPVLNWCVCARARQNISTHISEINYSVGVCVHVRARISVHISVKLIIQ